MVVLCFCLGALGALAAYLVTSFDEERQDMDLVERFSAWGLSGIDAEMNMSTTWQAYSVVALFLRFLPILSVLNNAEFTVERMKSPLWFDEGFDNYHEFDNPSVFSMMDHYYYTELAGNGHTIYDQQGAEKRFHGSSVSAHSHITGHSMASQVSYQLYDGAASMASSKSPSMAHIPSPFRVTRRLSSSSSPKRKLEPHEALDGVQPLDLSMENPVGEVSVNLDAKK
eukprot:jgi/Bigna1/144715/aug1.90_g19423